MGAWLTRKICCVWSQRLLVSRVRPGPGDPDVTVRRLECTLEAIRSGPGIEADLPAPRRRA